jgi:uncharacterized protein YgbK (DUF1537 family)
MRRTWIIADDLTGAADSGVPFARPAGDVILDLEPDSPTASPTGAVQVIDTDTREADPAVVTGRMAAVAGRIGPDDLVLKKIDSLMRGHIDRELRILRKALPDRLLVIAPAVPALGRTIAAGHLRFGAAGAAIRIADHIPARNPLHAGPRDAATAVRTALATGADAVICDAETDDDLAALVRGALTTGVPLLWVGAAGLAAALARSAGRGPSATRTPAATDVLVVVGSHSRMGLAQVKALAEAGHPAVEFTPADLIDGELPSGAGTRVVSLNGDVDPDLRRHAATTLGEICAPAVRHAEVVILSGGATARAVLTAAGIGALHLRGELGPGIVLSRPHGTDRPMHVITKSGSFGDEHSLVRLVAAVTASKGQP